MRAKNGVSIIAILLGLFAFLLSLVPCFRGSDQPVGDERRFVVTSMTFLRENHRPPVYLYSNTYMAPIQESLAAPLYFMLGERILIWKLLGALFVGLASSCVFLHLRVIYDVRIALAATLLFAAPNRVVLNIRTLSPGYPLGLVLCVVLMVSLTRRSPHAPLLCGLLAGLLHYAFPVMAPYLIVYFVASGLYWSGAWVAARSASLPFSFFVLLVSSAVALAPATYFYFTRGRFPRDEVRCVGLAVGILTLIGASVVLSRAIGLRRALFAAKKMGLLSAGFVLVWMTHNALYRTFDQPVLTARKVEMYAGSIYRLRSYGEWPKMAWLTLTRVLPIAASPIVADHEHLIPTYDHQFAPLDLPLIFAGLVVMGIGAVGVHALLRGVKWDLHTAPKLFYPAATILVIVLMMPSWQVNSDHSVRYIIPTLPGLWVLICLGVERLAGQKSVLPFAIMVTALAVTRDIITSQ